MAKSSSQIQSREKTESLLRQYLIMSGFENFNNPRANGEQGAAVIATKDGVTYFFEVVGAKTSGPSRSIDFKVALCQAITRLTGARNEKVVIAMPEVFFLNGMQARARKFGNYAWIKIGKVFPLELWFISPQEVEIKQWMDFL